MLRHVLHGAAGAVAMSAARALVKRAGLLRETPPEAITRQTLSRWTEAPPVRAAAHVGYGAAGGAVYAVLPPELRRTRRAGAAYGVATWILFEAVLAPLLGLRQARERRLVERVVLLGDHVLYGLVVARADASREPARW